MDLGITEAQRELRRRVEHWLAGAPIPALVPDLAERFEQTRVWQQALYDAGFLGWGWPEEHGGRGGTLLDQVIVYEALTEAGAPMPAGLVGLEVVGPTIAQYATPRQADRFLPKLLRGDEIWSQGFSEPDAGSDLASLRTRAVPTQDGYLLTGQKVWTSWAQFSQWCAVLARTDPDAPKHRGITFFLVDLASPGIEVRPIEQPSGELEFSELFFDDVEVPADNVLGALNDGWRVTMNTLSNERGPAMLRRLAELRAAYRDLLGELRAQSEAHALDARVIDLVGEIEVLMNVMRARAFRIADRVRRGEESAEDSIDKVFLTQVEQSLFGIALNLMSPTGAWAGDDGGRWVKDYLFGRAASIYGGTSEIQYNIIAQRFLGLGRG